MSIDFAVEYAEQDAALAEMQWEFENRYAPCATPGDAHAEWHRNAGVPMGTPGCPQDACHPIDDFIPEPEAGEGIRCAHCKGRHWSVADVRSCAGGMGVL